MIENLRSQTIWYWYTLFFQLPIKGDENLTEEERKAAWEEFENEKKGISNFSEVGELNPNLLLSNINPAQIQVNTNLYLITCIDSYLYNNFFGWASDWILYT